MLRVPLTRSKNTHISAETLGGLNLALGRRTHSCTCTLFLRLALKMNTLTFLLRCFWKMRTHSAVSVLRKRKENLAEVDARALTCCRLKPSDADKLAGGAPVTWAPN